MKKSIGFGGFIGLVAFVILLMAVIYYGMWKAWIWAMPQFFPNGNEAIIRPSFGLFVVAALLVSFIGKSIFGGNEKS